MIERAMGACLALVKRCPGEQTLSEKQSVSNISQMFCPNPGSRVETKPLTNPPYMMFSALLSSRLKNCLFNAGKVLLWREKEGPQVNTQHVSSAD